MLNKLRVQMPQLPAELLQRGSDLCTLVTLAGDRATRQDPGFHALVNKTRELIKLKCPAYRPCLAEKYCCLCRSGEAGATPYRGEECTPCVVSQISKSGVFIGHEDNPSKRMPLPGTEFPNIQGVKEQP